MIGKLKGAFCGVDIICYIRSMNTKRKSLPTKPHDVDFPKFHPAYILASWFWVGRLPYAPGTWGSLAALPLWMGLLFTNIWCYLAVLIFLFIYGAIAIQHIQEKKTHDASVFVVDEVVGVGIACLPLTVAPSLWWQWLIMVGIFRIFDIWKPWPIRTIDRKLLNGWGVMLDDVLAGIYSILAYFLFIYAVIVWVVYLS